MAKTGAIRAGKAYVELFADNSRLIRGLRAAERSLRAFGNNIRNLGLKMAALGTAVTLPFINAARTFSRFGDQVAKMAKRTGLSVETLSELRYVASQTGTEFESLEMAFRKMQRSIYDAGRGLSTAIDALADLNLTFEQLKDLSPEEQFKLIAERLSQIEDPTRRAGIAMSLFGRTGTNLLPMFEKGAAGIEALQQEARRLGLTMSSEDARAAEDFTDAMDRLFKIIKMSSFYIGSSLAPALEKISDTIASITGRINNWIKANKALVFSAAMAGAALVAVGAALITLGFTISALGAAVGVLASIMGGIGAIVAAITSPVGLVIAAVTELTVAILHYTDIGGRAVDWLRDRFRNLASELKESLSAMGDAIASGDVALAARILWLTLKMEWIKGVQFLQRQWLRFKNAFLKVAYDAFYGMQAAWEVSVNAVVIAMIEATAALKKAWSNFTSWHASAVEKTANWIAKKWMWLQSLFDDSIDMKFVTDYLDEQSKEQFEKIEKQRTDALEKAEDKRRDMREDAAREHDRNMNDLAEDYQRHSDKLESDYEKRISETERKLAEAREEWKRAVAAVRQTESESDTAGHSLAGIGDMMTAEMKRITAAGTFSSENLWGLSAGSAMDRTAAATEQTARNTKRLVDETKNNNAAFG